MNKLPETVSLQLSPDISLELRLIPWVPSDSFLMGSRGNYADEEPMHRVHISRPFYLGIFPVTQEQFKVWTEKAGIAHQNGFPDHPQHPAENMDWHEATAFCDWITITNAKYLPSGYVAGLPTEAQWEYACRAGTETEYHTGDGEAALAAAGWYRRNSESSTQRVGQQANNEWGLYDMHGNVWELCQDAWEAKAYRKRSDGVCDPIVTSDDKDVSRVIRGGSWVNSPVNCRSAVRRRWRPDYRDGFRGFRVCLSPGPSTSEETSAAVSEPLTADDQTRQGSESQANGGDAAEVDLSRSNLPPHNGGT